jgi:cysteine desulfurase
MLDELRKQRGQSVNVLPLLFHTYAAQAANYLDLHAARLGVDLLTLNGGKVYGPKQSGVLYVKAGLSLQPLVDGGGQEQGLRSGTENVPAAIGFATALELAQAMRHDEVNRLQRLQKQLIDEVTQAVPTVRLNGSKSKRLPNNVHLTFPGVDNERLLIQLDELGILAAAGSACSASNEEPSHVLHALGLSDAAAQNSVRFTLGRATTDHDITTVVQTLTQLLA